MRYDIRSTRVGMLWEEREQDQGTHKQMEPESMNDTELLRMIYNGLNDAVRILNRVDGLMRQREMDWEIEEVRRSGGSAGWSRFLTQLRNYAESYGLSYLESLKKED